MDGFWGIEISLRLDRLAVNGRCLDTRYVNAGHGILIDGRTTPADGQRQLVFILYMFGLLCFCFLLNREPV